MHDFSTFKISANYFSGYKPVGKISSFPISSLIAWLHKISFGAKRFFAFVGYPGGFHSPRLCLHITRLRAKNLLYRWLCVIFFSTLSTNPINTISTRGYSHTVHATSRSITNRFTTIATLISFDKIVFFATAIWAHSRIFFYSFVSMAYVTFHSVSPLIELYHVKGSLP